MTKVALMVGLAVTLLAGSALANEPTPHPTLVIGRFPAKYVPFILIACTALSRNTGAGCTAKNLENATIGINDASPIVCIDFEHVTKTRSPGTSGRYLYCIDSRTMNVHSAFPQ